MEQNQQMVVMMTREVVQGLVGLDHPGFGRHFAGVYQVVVTVYEKHKTQLDHLANQLIYTDMETTLQSFSGVLDKLVVDGQMNAGRVASVLAFAGCLVQHCVKKEVISLSDVDQLAEAMGRQLASRLINNQHSLVRICYCYYRPQLRCGNVFSSVCVCLSVCSAVTFEILDPES